MRLPIAILPGPEPLGDVLADDHDVRTAGASPLEERPAVASGIRSVAKKSGDARCTYARGTLLRVHGRLPFRRVEHGARQPAERRIGDEAGGRDARQRAHPIEQRSADTASGRGPRRRIIGVRRAGC